MPENYSCKVIFFDIIYTILTKSSPKMKVAPFYTDSGT